MRSTKESTISTVRNIEIWGAIERKINNCDIAFSLVLSNFEFGSSSKSRSPPPHTKTFINDYKIVTETRTYLVTQLICILIYDQTYTGIHT